ncbi:MAG: O-antigen ligase family protein [Bacteroidaceae bacterium]|nr:O-antigen ligase family protein [Bacteroidaceae bacterium]
MIKIFHLVVSLLTAYMIVRYHEAYSFVVKGDFLLMILCVVYILTSLYFFLCNKKSASKFVIIPFVLICAYEAFLGLCQLLGYTSSHHRLYSITGSFHNPGPYGGLLAVCISLFVAYYVKYGDDKQGKHLSKLWYYIVTIVAVAAIIILPSTQSRSSILALGCSLALLAVGTERIREKIKPFLRKYGLWLALGLLVAGTGAYLFKKPSADGRLFMDKICINAISDNGWWGAGTGHFGAAYGQAQARYFKQQIDENGKDDLDWRAINEHDRMTADCPDSAFNEFLFLGVEEGPIVMLLFIALIVTAIIISLRSDTIWCYGLTTLAVFAFFSFPFHVVQFQIMLTVLLSACVSDSQFSICFKDRSADSYTALAIMMTLLMVLSVSIALRGPQVKRYKQAALSWKKVEKWHLMEYYEYVVEDADELVPFMNNDRRFLFAYGQSLNKMGEYVKSDSILKLGTEISSDPMFWNVMGNNSLAQGKIQEAEERYRHAFYMVPNRLYPLCLLAKLYHKECDTVRFCEMADVVEHFIPKVESDNTERLRSEIRDLFLELNNIEEK